MIHKRTNRTRTALQDSQSVSFPPEPQKPQSLWVPLSSTALPNMHKTLGFILSTTKKEGKTYNQDKIKQTSYVTQA